LSRESIAVEERARAIIREIDKLLSDLIDLLKPYMDPIDQFELERDAYEIIKKLSAWIEAVEIERDDIGF
jgi:hypothetical protein